MQPIGVELTPGEGTPLGETRPTHDVITNGKKHRGPLSEWAKNVKANQCTKTRCTGEEVGGSLGLRVHDRRGKMW